MRKRVPLIVALAVALGLISATPAQASFLVSEIWFGGPVTFYSPYDGPASIRFTFNDFTAAQPGVDSQTTFQLRLRVKDASTSIHTENVTIDPSTTASPHTVQFDWPALNTTTEKKYEVAVHRVSGTLMSERTFTLKPYLVKIQSISPNPFYPTIDDGFKDTTTITYDLAASSNPVEVIIENSVGTEVRRFTRPNLSPGMKTQIWNGENSSGQVQPEGVYTVIVEATDSGQVFGQSQATVTLDRFFTATASKTQNGDAYHHRDPTTVLRSGGTCRVRRLTTPHDLRINCNDARVRVYWRWTLTEPDAAIQTVSFTLIAVSGYTCGATDGKTGSDSYIQVGALGQRRCRVDKAHITYSFTDES